MRYLLLLGLVFGAVFAGKAYARQAKVNTATRDPLDLGIDEEGM